MAISRDELIRILADVDPVGLVRQGAPKDEYAAEADEILALETVTLTDITTIFAVSFTEPGACSREDAAWIVDEMRRRDGGR